MIQGLRRRVSEPREGILIMQQNRRCSHLAGPCHGFPGLALTHICPSCGRAVRLRLDGETVAHETDSGHCPGSGEQPVDAAPLACWLPARNGLAPDGLRHSHDTWMAEDGIPEILAEQRLGHQVPGMRGLYAHASQRMRDELTAALQARWAESLRERAAIDPHPPVPLLDNLLAPYRGR